MGVSDPYRQLAPPKASNRAPTGIFQKNMGFMGFWDVNLWVFYGDFWDFISKYGCFMGFWGQIFLVKLSVYTKKLVQCADTLISTALWITGPKFSEFQGPG